MTKLAELERELNRIIDEYRREDHIPGVALAVGAGDDVIECTSGVLNLNTGVEVTPDSLFQVGSITKTFVATLVMQLVDEGLVDLDTPVHTYVPEFAAADAEAVTVRQLLCHTGGLEGDVFGDFGRGDDAVARYVEALKGQRRSLPPGRAFSYCNSGFCVLARLVEQVRGLPSWDAALRRGLIGPLGFTHVATLAEEAIMFRTAVGHVGGGGGGAPAGQRVAPSWQMPWALSPAGAALCFNARELVEWGRFQLGGGLAGNGTRVLSAESVAAMHEAQTRLPSFGDGGPQQSWGLGWNLVEFADGKVFGHSGGTIGQTAMLEIAPETAVVYALLVNGGTPTRLIHAIRSRVFGELAGIEIPPRATPPTPPAVGIDPRRFVGRYQTFGMYYDVRQDSEGGLVIESGLRGTLQELFREEPKTYRVTGYSPSALITSEPEHGVHLRWAFPEVDAEGRATFVFDGSRLAPRVGDPES